MNNILASFQGIIVLVVQHSPKTAKIDICSAMITKIGQNLPCLDKVRLCVKVP